MDLGYRDRPEPQYWKAVLLLLIVILMISPVFFPEEADKALGVVSEWMTGELKFEEPVEKTYGEVSLTMHKTAYDYFNGKPKTSVKTAQMSEEQWNEGYYTQFVEREDDEFIVDELLEQLTTIEAVVSFVQNLGYDYEKFGTEGTLPQYPYETLYRGRGTCGDKSILLAKALKQAGYGVALLFYKERNHMGVGVKASDGYCYIEATRPFTMCKAPEEFAGLEPQVIVVSDGKAYNG